MNYNELEFLLDQLQGVIRHRFCVIPNHIGEAIYLGVFGNDGTIMWEQTCVNLEECVNNFLTWKKKNDG